MPEDLTASDTPKNELAEAHIVKVDCSPPAAAAPLDQASVSSTIAPKGPFRGRFATLSNRSFSSLAKLCLREEAVVLENTAGTALRSERTFSDVN